MKNQRANAAHFLTVLLFIFLSNSILAKPFTIRLNSGLGYANSSNAHYRARAYHVGMRFLLHAGDVRRYGVEFSYLNQNQAGETTLLGIVLENKLDWFLMTIGTVGYFNFADTPNNLVGLTTNLGWEPNSKKLRPTVVFRNDVIFASSVVVIPSLSVGISW